MAQSTSPDHRLAAWFGHTKPIIGVIHLPPLPGSPRASGAPAEAAERVRADARALLDGGASGIIIENFGDAPFHADRVPPATVAAMTALALEVRREAPALPIGVNVLRNDAVAALSIAHAIGGRFIRVNVHTGAMVTDQGLVQGRADRTLRTRRALGATDVGIFADVGVKHAAPLVDRPLPEEAAETVGRGLADAIILTGSMTGRPVDRDALAAVRRAIPTTPLVIGSGATPETIADLLADADAAIVGTALKVGGDVEAPVDAARVRALVTRVASVRREVP